MNSVWARLGMACRWGAVVAVIAGYALLSHHTASSAAPSVTGAVIASGPLLGLSFLLAWRSARRAQMLLVWLTACALLYVVRGWLVAHYHWVFLLEHAGTYGLLCVSFGLSLRNAQTPLVSRFAATVHGKLSPVLSRYTRSVTLAWTLYFGTVASLSVLLFWLAPLPAWSSFAYLMGPPLLVLMFSGEYAARFYFLPPEDRTGPLEAIRAYRQSSQKPALPPHA